MGYQHGVRVEERAEICRLRLRLHLHLLLHLPLLTASPAEALHSSPQHSEGEEKAWPLPLLPLLNLRLPLNLGSSIINKET
jgi:hypothetical protein